MGMATEEELACHKEKWVRYGTDYILPCFDLAEKCGIDLRQLVRDNAGKNCVILLVEELIRIARIDKRIKDYQIKPTYSNEDNGVSE